MICCGTCHSCGIGVCTEKFGHSGDCTCKYPSCAWRGSDFPVEETDLYEEIVKTLQETTEPSTQLTPLPEKHIRPIWHETWMATAHVMGERSYDPRLKVGAIVVTEDNSVMLSVGYNGNYAGGPNTPESAEPGASGFIHAEANALIKCPYHYHLKKVMYVTHSPCRNCAKMIVNAGISRVIYDIEYRDTSGIELMRSVGITVEKISNLLVRK